MIGLDPGGSLLPPLGALSEGLRAGLLDFLRKLHSAGTLPIKPASLQAASSPASAS
jgi:hypothetical protein